MFQIIGERYGFVQQKNDAAQLRRLIVDILLFMIIDIENIIVITMNNRYCSALLLNGSRK